MLTDEQKKLQKAIFEYFEWEKRARETLEKPLPTGYAWKKFLRIERIKEIIAEASKIFISEAEYKIKLEVGRKVVHGHLFGRTQDSKQPKTFAIGKRKAKQYVGILTKALEVPFLKAMGEEITKKIKLVADIYNFYGDDRLTEKLGLTKVPLKNVDHALKKKMVLDLHGYLRSSLAVARGYAKEWGESHPKTEKFLMEVISDLLPESHPLTPKQVRKIVLKK